MIDGKMNTTFSVIMPVWNRVNIVQKAIKSVLSQTFKEYELIIIDDGSTDNLKRVVQSYLSENIKYYKISHQGVVAARNYGIERSKGDFIAYLDSDNTWNPDFLSEMYKALNKNGTRNEAAYCRYNFYKKDSSTGKVYLSEVKGEKFVFKKLLLTNYIDLNTFVHAKKCLKKVGFFDTRLRRLSDWDLIIRITSKYQPVYVQEVLVNYYFSTFKNTLTKNKNKKKGDYYLVKSKYNRQITINHDKNRYKCENISNKKYLNWVSMMNQKINTIDFTTPGFPFMLQIEPTNMCNLSCPLCPVGRNELNRKPRHMRLEEFKSIIDDMREYLLFLILWDWGEPFINPELPNMIEYASNLGIETVTSTNAHFLNDNDYLKRIFKSGLSTLIIAIDSLNEENYKIYRQRGSLHRAILGLKNALRIKKELKSKTIVNLRMVIMKQNEKELKDMRRWAKKLKVDRFTVKTLNPSCGLNSIDEELVPNNPKYRRYKYKNNSFERIRINTPCTRIYNMSNIISNGDVVPCCYDYAAELKVGNIHEKPYSEIWNSPSYRELRKKIYYHKDSIPKCRECTINFALSESGWIIEDHDYNKANVEKLISLAIKYYDKSKILQKVVSKLQNSSTKVDKLLKRFK